MIALQQSCAWLEGSDQLPSPVLNPWQVSFSDLKRSSAPAEGVANYLLLFQTLDRSLSLTWKGVQFLERVHYFLFSAWESGTQVNEGNPLILLDLARLEGLCLGLHRKL